VAHLEADSNLEAALEVEDRCSIAMPSDYGFAGSKDELPKRGGVGRRRKEGENGARKGPNLHDVSLAGANVRG